MIRLTKSSKIFILCPSNHFTGGPLALHQLGFFLRKNGLNAYMLYVPENENPIHTSFINYGIPYTFKVEDQNTNLIILPEVMTEYSYNLRFIKKAIWWLSVDNFFKESYKEKILRTLRLSKKFSFRNSMDYFHFTQSFYAYQFLINKRISKDRISMLSDYLLEEFLEQQLVDITAKKDVVLYNPKKGFEFTKKLINKSKHLFNWVPIENMNPSQVKTLLLTSKIYVDFGNHPGKDRFPREAVMCGCCIITNKYGSAKYQEDIPIPEEFKFNTAISEIDSIINKIRYILKNFEVVSKSFQSYRESIKSQPEIFENEIRYIFKFHENYEN